MLSAAGSMVPDPSIIPPPIPFIDVVTTGRVAEYMATARVDDARYRRASHFAATATVRKSDCD